MNDEQRWADQKTVDAMTIHPATMPEVAGRLGISPSQRLQKRLKRLADEGRIGRTRVDGSLRWVIGGHG